MIANIFDAALERWIVAGQPHGAVHVITKPTHDDRSLIWPSRFASCPCAHAHERCGDKPRLIVAETLEQRYRKALGHETARRWADILSTAGYEVWTEDYFEAKGFAGHLDIKLKLQPGLSNYLPIEIKDTGLRLAQSHFWQATAYAYTWAHERCAMVLDRRDGQVDLVGIWRDPVDFVAHDLRTGSPLTWRGQAIYRISDEEIQKRLNLHQTAYEDVPEKQRLPAITHTKCVRVDNKAGDAETICPYWCWTEEVRAHWQCVDWNIDIGIGTYPVTKGEW